MEKELFENRKIFAQNLIDLFNSEVFTDEGGITISIDGEWGTGKTFFIDKLVDMLDSDFGVLKYDAWKSDYNSDPLMTIAELLVDKMKSENYDKGKIEQFAKTVGKVFFKTTPALINGMMENKIGFSFNTIAETIKDTGNVIENYIDEMGTTSSVVEEFKNQLEKYAAKIINDGKKKVIILIDELDRCRPDHALNVLETIKHFFDVENYIFLIFNNKDQLKATIKCIYGLSNQEFYLEKFYDYQLTLPTPDKSQFIETIFEKMKIKNKDDRYKSAMLDHFINYFKVVSHNFSFREIEKIAKYYELIFNMFYLDSFYKIYIFPLDFLCHCYKKSETYDEFPLLSIDTENTNQLYGTVFEGWVKTNTNQVICDYPVSEDYPQARLRYIEIEKDQKLCKVYVLDTVNDMYRQEVSNIMIAELVIKSNVVNYREIADKWSEIIKIESKEIQKIINIFPENNENI